MLSYIIHYLEKLLKNNYSYTNEFLNYDSKNIVFFNCVQMLGKICINIEVPTIFPFFIQRQKSFNE